MRIPRYFHYFSSFLSYGQFVQTMVNGRCPKGQCLFFGKFPFVIITLAVLISNGTLRGQSDTTRNLPQATITGATITDAQTITPSQVVGSADFKRTNSYNVADAVRNFSGINVKDYGGIGGLKTVSVRSLGATHTAVQYDGVPVTDAQNGQIDLGKISLENVRKITLYNGQPGELCLAARSFASASLLAIESLVPRLDTLRPFRLVASLTSGSFGLVNPSLQWQQRWGNRWSSRVTSSYQKAHGRYRFKVDGDGSDTLAVRSNAQVATFQNDAALFWTRNDSNQFYIRANYYHSDRGLPGAVIYYNPVSNQHLWNRDFFVQTRYNRKWSRLQLLLLGKFSDYYTRYLDPDFLNNAGGLDQRYKQKEYYGAASATYRLLKGFTVGYASDFSVTELTTSQKAAAFPQRLTYVNVLSTHYQLDQLELQASLLNTTLRENAKTGEVAPGRSVWSPAVLASYRPFRQADVLLRAFYKEVFRNPTFNDLYYSRSGNRSLKPEYAVQYNLGFSFHKDFNRYLEYLTVTTDAYYNYIRDKIIAIPNKDLFSWTMLNLGKVDIRGIDSGLKVRTGKYRAIHGVLAVNYTYQEALDVTDEQSSTYLDQIPYTPKNSLTYNVGLDSRRWGVFFNHTYSSSRYYFPENQPEYLLPAIRISDVSALYRFGAGTSQWIVSAEISNVFNKPYAYVRSFPMPGRSFRFAIQISI